MNFRNRLQYYLVKQAGISHKLAKEYIENGEVCVDDTLVYENVIITPYTKVSLNQKEISKTTQLIYLAYYKPAGVECTMNENISGNLKQSLTSSLHKLQSAITLNQHIIEPVNDLSGSEQIDQAKEATKLPELFYIGRLDKASEGLLLLTNDGNVCNKIISPDAHIPKVYKVHLEKPYDKDFVIKMENGVKILNTITKPCKVEPIDEISFKITLTQGMNRQIRRMCFALDNYVIELIRLSVGTIALNGLNKSEIRYLNRDEINYLQNL